MGEGSLTMKRFSMRYESDDIVCGSNDHTYGCANSLNVAKQYIAKCKASLKDRHPRNFRIYDHFADIDPVSGFVPIVYQED